MLDMILRLVKNIIPLGIMMIMNGWDKLKNGKAGLLAFELLKVEFPEATLHLYGSDTERGGLANKDCETISTNGIYFHGTISHDVLMKEISSSHVLIHPAFEESFGVVLIETMSQGIPSIGGEKSGAVPWVIDNTELLVDISKPLAIKEKLIKHIENQIFYEEKALKCYNNTLRRFSDKGDVKSYESYYNEILIKW
jgi:glycosyltransferase involved in cell wall biosynthesis